MNISILFHRYVLLLIIFLPNALAFPLLAQKQPPVFQITDLPNKAGYDKAKLNAEIANLTDRTELRKALKRKPFPAETMVVVKISNPGSRPMWWRIMLGGPLEKKDNSIILQSKGNTTVQLYRLSDFKNLFRDTLAIIDTLSAELFIHDEDYPKDHYELACNCSGNDKKGIIPFQNGKLLFTNKLLDSCAVQPLPVIITNSNQPDRTLASCKLIFLLPDQQEILTDLADFYRNQYPDKAKKDINLLVWNWATTHWGKPLLSQLNTLLSKQQP